MMQVEKWGNSLAVRLTKTVVDALGLQSGDEITITVIGARSIEIGKKPDVTYLIERVRAVR